MEKRESLKPKRRNWLVTKRYGTYEEVWSSEVPEADRDKIITTTWKVLQKDNIIIKARVCVRSFQEKMANIRHSPTASKISQRLLLRKTA